MDRINMNVFREIKEKKHGTGNKGSNIYAKPKPKDPNKKFTRPTGEYTLNNEPQNAQSTGVVAKGKNIPPQPSGYNLPDDVDLFYADPNNFKMQTKTTINPQGVVTRTNGTGITTIQAMVKNPKNPNQPEAYQYKIRTKKAEAPDLDVDMNKLSLQKQQMSKEQKQIAKMQAQFMVNTVKQNRLTFGMQSMVDNERLHAQEAIESGLYIGWSSRKDITCFRVGSNSMCICGHGFPSHDCVVTQKKFSTKCHNCKCKEFKFIPQFPEEIGEYWIPHQKGFSYQTYRCKCKCKHTWNEHNGEGYLNCKKCGCGSFSSAFCCAVCDRFWQDHEMLYETEKERLAEGKPVREGYIPYNEMPEMYDALYK